MKPIVSIGVLLLLATDAFGQMRGTHGFRGGFSGGGFRGGFVGGGFRGGTFVRPGFAHQRLFPTHGFFGHQPSFSYPRFGFGYGYSYPIFVGGFSYGYSNPYYAPPPLVQYIEPYAPPAPIVVSEDIRVVRPEPEPEYERGLIYLIAFKDGEIRAAVAYWTSGRTLHYVTREKNEERTAPLDALDRELSRQLNRERRVPFWLPLPRE